MSDNNTQPPADDKQDSNSQQNSGNSDIDEILNMEPTEVPEIGQAELAAAQGGEGETSASKESKRIRWKCRNCEYQYEGYKKLEVCPRCGKDSSYFEDVE